MTEQVNEVANVPGTEMPIDKFANEFADRVIANNMNTSEAERWAEEEAGVQSTDEVKAAVVPAITEKLKEKMIETSSEEKEAESEEATDQEDKKEEVTQEG